MNKFWDNIPSAGKFLMVWGLLIIGCLIYDVLFHGLPNNFDAASSDLLLLIFALVSIFYGLRMSYKEPAGSDTNAYVYEKYEVKKIAMYGSKSFGPYDNYKEAQVELKKLEAQSFDDEAIWEIKKVNDKDKA